jgi:hypothetical protein
MSIIWHKKWTSMFSYLIADKNFDCFDPAGMQNKLKNSYSVFDFSLRQ